MLGYFSHTGNIKMFLCLLRVYYVGHNCCYKHHTSSYNSQFAVAVNSADLSNFPLKLGCSQHISAEAFVRKLFMFSKRSS